MKIIFLKTRTILLIFYLYMYVTTHISMARSVMGYYLFMHIYMHENNSCTYVHELSWLLLSISGTLEGSGITVISLSTNYIHVSLKKSFPALTPPASSPWAAWRTKRHVVIPLERYPLHLQFPSEWTNTKNTAAFNTTRKHLSSVLLLLPASS